MTIENSATLSPADVDFLLSSTPDFNTVARILAPHTIKWEKTNACAFKDPGLLYALTQVSSFKDLKISQYSTLLRLGEMFFMNYSQRAEQNKALASVLLSTERNVKQAYWEFERCVLKILKNKNAAHVPPELAPLLDRLVKETSNPDLYIFSKDVLDSWLKSSGEKEIVKNILVKRKEIDRVDNVYWRWHSFFADKKDFLAKDVTPSFPLKDYSESVAVRLLERLFEENAAFVPLYATKMPTKAKADLSRFYIPVLYVMRALEKTPHEMVSNCEEIIKCMRPLDRSDLLTRLTIDLAFRKKSSVPADKLMWMEVVNSNVPDPSVVFIEKLIQQGIVPAPTPLRISLSTPARHDFISEKDEDKKWAANSIKKLSDLGANNWFGLDKLMIGLDGKQITHHDYLKSLKDRGFLHKTTEGFLGLLCASFDQKHPFSLDQVPHVRCPKDSYLAAKASIKKIVALSKVSYQKSVLLKSVKKSKGRAAAEAPKRKM